MGRSRPQSVSFVFVVYSHHKHSKYLEREFNHGYCLTHNFFMDIASCGHFCFFLDTALGSRILIIQWKLYRWLHLFLSLQTGSYFLSCSCNLMPLSKFVCHLFYYTNMQCIIFSFTTFILKSLVISQSDWLSAVQFIRES